MDCSTARMLAAFARPGHSEIEPADARALADHLDDCPDCRFFRNDEQRFERHFAAAMKAVPVPPAFHANLLTRLANERNAGQIRTLRRVAFWSAASLVALLLLGITLFALFQPPPVPPTKIGIDELAGTPRYWINKDQPLRHLEEVEDWFHQRGAEHAFPREFRDSLRVETLDGATITMVRKDQHHVRVPTLILRKGNLQARVFIIYAANAVGDEFDEIRREQAARPRSVDRWVIGNLKDDSKPKDATIAYIILDSGRFEDFFQDLSGGR